MSFLLGARFARAGKAVHERRDSEPLSFSAATPFAGARIQRIALIVVTITAFVAAAWIALALWAALLLGLLIAFAVEPAHRRVLRLFPRRRALAAAITVTSVALVGAAAVAAVGALLTTEIIDSIDLLRQRFVGGHVLQAPALARRLEPFGITPQMVNERAIHLADRAAELASGAASAFVGSALSWVGGLFIAFVTAFYTLKDRRPIARRLAQLLPLHPQTTHELVEEFRKVGRGTLIGSVVAGFVQGLFATAGFAIGAVPRPVLLGVLTAAASFVPVFGTMLVWIPVGVALVLGGRPAAGAFELAWGALVTTSLVDYVLRPFLVGRESRSHPLLFLIGLIGGVELMGGIGIVAGPLLMAFFASVLRIYRREIVEPARREAEYYRREMVEPPDGEDG